MTREEIKKNLTHGDQIKVARKLGTHKDYVNQVLNNEKRGQRGKGKLILKELQNLAKHNINYFNNNN